MEMDDIYGTKVPVLLPSSADLQLGGTACVVQPLGTLTAFASLVDGYQRLVPEYDTISQGPMGHYHHYGMASFEWNLVRG